MIWARMLAYITGTVDQELLLRNGYLSAENRILRAQVKGRLLLSDPEKATLAEIAHRLGRKALKEVAAAAKPDTLTAWYRQLIAKKFDGSKFRKSVGRPPVEKEIERLVVRMARENPSWGYDRIVGAMANLGHQVSDQTVGNILKRHDIPSAPKLRQNTTWKDFIRAHMAVMVGTDFFTVEVLTLKGLKTFLRTSDQLITGWCALLVLPRRLVRSAIVVKPSSLLNFHRALVRRKYRLLFSAKRRTRPGPKGPSADLIRAVVEMKQRNPRWGARALPSRLPWPSVSTSTRTSFAEFSQPITNRLQIVAGPSWLTFLGHAKDSLHSIDLFRCESVALWTYWVLVVMDQYTRRIIGFGVHRGIVDGVELYRMFKRAIRWQTVPKYLSSDRDPLYRFHQWQANLRVLGVTEIKIVPYVPMSHPFVERLIGTIRREYLDVALFWTAVDS